MTQNYSTFKELPAQLEWALVALLGYDAYVLPHTSHAASYMTILCGAIVLNGWISSRAGAEFYNDILISVDVSILFLYYLMLNSLKSSSNSVPAEFWMYSAVLALAYLVWDSFILGRAEPARKKQYILYIVLLAMITIAHFLLALVTHRKWLREAYIAAIGGSLWIVVLLLWHLDKWRVTHTPKRMSY
jgi:hypothetical protein